MGASGPKSAITTQTGDKTVTIFEAIHVIHVNEIKASQGMRLWGQRVNDISDVDRIEQPTKSDLAFRDGLERDGLFALQVLDTPISDRIAIARRVLSKAGLDENRAEQYSRLLSKWSGDRQVLRSLREDDPVRARYERMINRTFRQLPQVIQDALTS